MKILQMHADFIEYRPVRKEIADAEDSRTEPVMMQDVLVLFTAVEEGDDKETVQMFVQELRSFSEKTGIKRILIYPFAHLSQNLAAPRDALFILKEMEEEARKTGFEVTRAPFGWNKEFQIKVKGHPLAEMSRSYVKGEKKQARVVRKKEPTQKELLSRMRKVEHTGLPETDHRVIGERLDLFSFYEPSPSMPYWHDKGLTIRNILIETIRKELKRRGYIEISTALLANVDLWKLSGHYEHYKENMFLTSLGNDEEVFGLKPMNCPSTILYYMSRRWSYRDLPLRIADFDMLFRKELSGVVSGLFRVKSFTQDDAHIFCTEEQVENELKELIDLVDYFYKIFSLDYSAKVSTMPEEHLGTEEQWERATNVLINSLREKGIEPVIKEKEGAFYGPKIDFDVRDSMGREWQCATIQLDYQLPERFELKYIGKDGQEHRPVIIHRVIYGSIERFLGILLEHYQGKLPVWLSPVQVSVIPVSERYNDYARKIYERLLSKNVRAEVLLEQGTLNSKIRDSQLKKIPFSVIVGAREAETGRISVRERGGRQRNDIDLDLFTEEIAEMERKFM